MDDVQHDEGNEGQSARKLNKSTHQYLFDISIKQLKLWVEEDEDKKFQTEKTSKIEKLHEAQIMHEQFVKQKLAQKIPNEMENTKPMVTYGEEMERKMRDENAQAFENWLVLKELRETALRYLSFIKVSNSSSGANDRPETLRLSIASAKSDHESNTQKLQYCFNIGKALKKVDRSLYQDWYNWCTSNNVGISIQVATAVWDYFEPQACDIHSSSFSQVNKILDLMFSSSFFSN